VAERAKDPTPLFVLNAVYHGMRISEVVWLEVKNFYQKDGIWWLHIAKSKTGPRTIKVADVLVEKFRKAKADAESPWFFPKKRNPMEVQAVQLLERGWDQVRTTAEVDCVYHELRHTAISNAVRSGVNPGIVSRYYGVSLDEIDKTYLKLSAEDTTACADFLHSALSTPRTTTNAELAAEV
jgi:integrase